MLTIKAPIALHLSEGILTASEEMADRIRGNYAIFPLKIQPKELLFYLSTPPELPFPEETTASIAVQNTLTDQRTVVMEMITNVMNRILVENTNGFSYQDTVYIESVLRKVGITDTALFLQQASSVAAEQKNFKTLYALYQKAVTLQQNTKMLLSAQQPPSASPYLSEAEKSSPRVAYALAERIFERLETARIYDTVHAFQKEGTHRFGSFHEREVRLAEHWRASHQISVAAMQRQLVGERPLPLLHHTNVYETGETLPPIEREEQVVERVTAAMLLATVEHLATEKYFDRSFIPIKWYRLTRSLADSVEQTVARFRSFYNEGRIVRRDTVEESETYHRRMQAETEVLTALVHHQTRLDVFAQQLREQTDQVSLLSEQKMHTNRLTYRTEGAESPAEISAEALRNLEENSALSLPPPNGEGVETTSELRALTREQERHTEQTTRQLSMLLETSEQHRMESSSDALPPIPPLPFSHPEAASPAQGEALPSGADSSSIRFEQLRTDHTRERLLGSIEQQSPAAKASVEVVFPPSAVSLREQTVKEIELTYQVERWQQQLERLVLTDRQLPAEGSFSHSEHDAAAMSSTTTHTEIVSSPPPDRPTTVLPGETTILHPKTVQEIENIQASFPTAPTEPMPPVETAVREQTEPTPPVSPTPQKLRETLEAISEQNRQKFEEMQRLRVASTPAQLSSVDSRKTRAESLRALENPELVYRELAESMTELPSTPLPLDPKAAVYLQHADPVTRQLLETVLRGEVIQEGDRLVLPAEKAAALQAVLLQHPETLQNFPAMLPPTIGSEQQGFSPATPPPTPAVETVYHTDTQWEREEEHSPYVTRPTEADGYRTAASADSNEWGAVSLISPQGSDAGEEVERISEEIFSNLPPILSTTAETSRKGASPLQIIHKREQPVFTEEWLEKWQQTTHQTKLQTENIETIVAEHRQETTVQQLDTHEVVQKNEDITELVNRTLAKQMNHISDQVYRQMERRLQSERSRRGRF